MSLLSSMPLYHPIHCNKLSLCFPPHLGAIAGVRRVRCALSSVREMKWLLLIVPLLRVDVDVDLDDS